MTTVQPLDEEPAASVAPSVVEPAVPSQTAVADPPARPGRRRAVAVAAALFAVLVSVAVLLYWRHAPSTTPSGQVSTIVAEFNNTTGDAVFLGSLRRAAVVSLRQSPFVSVIADATIADVLQALGRAPNDVLTAPLARDVCARANGSVLVNGGIGFDGGTYTLVVEASQCRDARSSHASARHLHARTTCCQRSDERSTGYARRWASRANRCRRTTFRSRSRRPTRSRRCARLSWGWSCASSRQRAGDSRAQDRDRARPAIRAGVRAARLCLLEHGRHDEAARRICARLSSCATARPSPNASTSPAATSTSSRASWKRASEIYRLWTRMYPDEWLAYNALANDANLMGRYEIAVSAARRCRGPRTRSSCSAGST